MVLFVKELWHYETFVSRLRLEGHPHQPEWLSHVNATVLKVKLATAIIGISSIHLLKTFIEAGTLGGLPFCGTGEAEALAQQLAAAGSNTESCSKVTETGVMWQTAIHSVFILSALGIAAIDRVLQPAFATHGAPKRGRLPRSVRRKCRFGSRSGEASPAQARGSTRTRKSRAS